MDDFRIRVENTEYIATFLPANDPRAFDLEQALLGRNVKLPLTHTLAWIKSFSPTATAVYISDGQGRVECGFALEAGGSRILPGHNTLRLNRFGYQLAPSVARAGLAAAVHFANHTPLVLRLHVDLFDKDVKSRNELGEFLEGEGFWREDDMMNYSETVDIEILPDSEAMFRSLNSTARKNLKAIRNKPVTVEPIIDVHFAARLQELTSEVMTRTGGDSDDTNWERFIEFARDNPELMRIVGLFHPEPTGPESLLAFGVGRKHGNHIEYSTAAATRKTTLKAPLAYAPVWALIEWGRESGAEWFDFGGVTRGTASDDWDPLGGISDFKRYFSKNVISVGEEWVLDVSQGKAKFADAVSQGLRKMRSSITFGRPGQ